MSDVLCPKCGEPYEAYGLLYATNDSDFSPEEIRLFRAGKGCPSCHFGQWCPDCSGTGRERNIYNHNCRGCFGSHRAYVRRLARETTWWLGYSPTMRPVPEAWPVEQTGAHETRDGLALEGTCVCPECHTQPFEPCSSCDGAGTWRAWAERHNRDAILNGAMASLLDASEDDEINTIAQWAEME